MRWAASTSPWARNRARPGTSTTRPAAAWTPSARAIASAATRPARSPAAACTWNRSRPGVGCESCHGSAGKHVAAIGAGDAAAAKMPRLAGRSAEEISELCGQLPPHMVADCPERPARRAQRPLPAVPPGQQQMLRHRRRADPLHRLPRSARSAGDQPRQATMPNAPPAIPRRSHTKCAGSPKPTAPPATCRRSNCPARTPASRITRFASPAPASHIRTDIDQPAPVANHRRQFLLAGGAGSGLPPARGGSRSAPAVRGDPAGNQRNPLGPRQRRIARALPARDHGPGLRVSRLRQRRLDGHLPGQQRPVRFLQARQSPFATRSTRTIATAPSPT